MQFVNYSAVRSTIAGFILDELIFLRFKCKRLTIRGYLYVYIYICFISSDAVHLSS